MTNDERICGLETCGYTRRQAAFLSTVALHSGYFLRRQYHTFLGQKPGANAERLIQRGLARGHLRIHGSANRTLIYHLAARPLYELLAEENNPNQRWRQPFSIKLKLMGLDFVLAHPQYRYLATEEDKLGFFCGTLGLDRNRLFAREYHSRHLEGPTRIRYFADQFPIFVADSSPNSRSVVSLCYVDGARAKPAGFETYLKHYQDLFSILSSFEVVYVASDQQMFVKAERMFARRFHVPAAHLDEVRILPGLEEHFRIREQFELPGNRCLDQLGLDRFRDELQQYRGPQFEALYQQWKAKRNAGSSVDPGTTGSRPGFRFWRAADEYRLFGDLTSVTAA